MIFSINLTSDTMAEIMTLVLVSGVSLKVEVGREDLMYVVVDRLAGKQEEWYWTVMKVEH